MTPTEVLTELRKMPLEARRQVHDELHDELRDEEMEARLADLDDKQKGFLRSMLKKGLITGLPPRHQESAERRKFKPITVTGEPISETIIKERR